jgi:single-stranded DNA-binding protein
MKNTTLSMVEGRLTADPRIYYTKSGGEFCFFNIIVNKKTIKVNSSHQIADACAKYLKKGTKVRVKGNLRMAQKCGKDTYSIDAYAVEFLGIKK